MEPNISVQDLKWLLRLHNLKAYLELTIILIPETHQQIEKAEEAGLVREREINIDEPYILTIVFVFIWCPEQL